jgi:hypothetical protein
MEKMEKGGKKVKMNKGRGKGRKERGMKVRNDFFSLENNPSLVLKYIVHITTCLERNAAYILCRHFKLGSFI